MKKPNIMKNLILTLVLLLSFNSFTQTAIYNPDDDVLTIEIPTDLDELRGYPSPNELDSEAIIWYNLATEIIATRPNQAILLFKKAINKDPSFVQAYDNLAKTYRTLEEYDLAVKYYLLSQKIFPEGSSAYQNLAVVYRYQEKWDQAIRQYKMVISLNPDDPEGYYGLAGVYLTMGNDKLILALSNAKKALNLYNINAPNYIGDSYAQIGLIYFYTGEKVLAKQYLEIAKVKYNENNLSQMFSQYENLLNSL
jgi:tetratricopeptide (TPR) repeat protein|tara:strand:- start:124 stop:879 length:756 start_codon:yes stop_codon:yes gene_type:complete